MPKTGLKLTIPLEQDAIASTYLGADGKSLKVTVKEAKKKAAAATKPTPAIILNPPSTTPVSSGVKKIVIDAGHGGTDAGAVGGGTYEKDITLDVAKRVEDLLKKSGFAVLMTRPNDTYVSLQDRVAMSENIILISS